MTAPPHDNTSPGPPSTTPGSPSTRLADTQRGMRRRNLSRVLHAVAAHGPLSRAAVASRVGLTRAAVSTLVDDLIRRDLIDELGPERPGRVGRPGSALAVSRRGPVGIGAEVGVDHLAVCAVDLRGAVRARAARQGSNRGRPPGPVVGELAALVGTVSESVQRGGLRPAGLAVAVPGLVARDARTVVHAPNLGWHGVDLGPLLPDGLPLTVDNEANFGALGELWLGAGAAEEADEVSRQHPRHGLDFLHGPDSLHGLDSPHGPNSLHGLDFLHVSAEIGIGAALVTEGRLWRGTRGFAGELGHVPVRPEGRACPCGGRGCLEQYAGQEAVLRTAGLEVEGPAVDRVALLAERAAQGDRAVRRALRDAGAALGVALAGAVHLVDPRSVVLGGALSRLAPWLIPSLERELDRRAVRPASGVVVSRLGSDGPLLGAAHSVVRAVLDDPVGATGEAVGGSGRRG